MWKSQVVLEWKNAGQVEARRSDLLEVLRSRFQAEPSAEVTAAIQQITDLDVLSRWFRAALTAVSLEAVSQLIRPSPAPPAEPNG